MAVWWGPMAVAVIFGLAVATILTLVVVPVLYSISETASLKGAMRAISARFRKQEEVVES
jgi:Cu/Ag efflux pump CusA